jgi:hypothetical protein
MGSREHMSHDEYVTKQRGRARLVAKPVMSGEVSAVHGARLIVQLGGLELPEGDEDLEALRLVDSETDHLPVGEERQHWAPAALAERADELAKAERWAREVALTAFKNLTERW